MIVDLELLADTQWPGVPKEAQFREWIAAALDGLSINPTSGEQKPAELAIRLVDEQGSAELNETYRRKTGPTNILSFPTELPASVGDELPRELLGDLVICVPLVESEAKAQGKTALAHWAHLTVHGVLHLKGLDHLTDQEAEFMENLERDILRKLSIADPYAVND
jgi:probable rRNA maturation factor